MKSLIDDITVRPVSIAPLVVFRIIFGGMMAVSTVRFMLRGWVSELYIEPRVFFPFYGFEWVKPLPGNGMYVVFTLILLSALLVMVGLFYRWAAAAFFVLFTYVELIDKTNYLNHYYFVSLVAFLMILLPADRYFSADSRLWPAKKTSIIPAWPITLLQFQLAVVYVYAGIAKLNSEWLLEAMPLRIWLPAKAHLPVVGPLLEQEWVAYAMSWGGAFYDLFIVFFLMWSVARPYAYFFVVFFHLVTAWLFPAIGMFPYIMILATLIFFPAAFHEKILARFGAENPSAKGTQPVAMWGPAKVLLGAYVVWQLVMPWRYLLYPSPLFWREEGYRFSWRVMLMEKAGYVTFHVSDPATGRQGQIANHEYLTPQQEKMVATQPDMILQFAHYLAEDLKQQGLQQPEVRAEAWVTLNGRRSRPFTDATVDLAKERPSLQPKTWILPFE